MQLTRCDTCGKEARNKPLDVEPEQEGWYSLSLSKKDDSERWEYRDYCSAECLSVGVGKLVLKE